MIYCVGDSHVSVFSGFGSKDNYFIQNVFDYKSEQINKLKNFIALRIGAPTAFNFHKKIDVVENVLSFHKFNSNDYLLLSAGEIDCRCHIVKQSRNKNISIEESAKLCFDNYKLALDYFKKYNLICYNVIPPINLDEEQASILANHRVYGSIEERLLSALEFNKHLNKYCSDNNVIYLDAFSICSNNNVISEDMLMDHWHLDQNFLEKLLVKMEEDVKINHRIR